MTQTATEPMSNWQIERHYSTVQFTIKHLFFFTVEGRFTDITGSIKHNRTDLSRSTVEAIIKVASLDSGNRKRDEHLLSADFLDADEFPEIHFVSRKVEKGRDLDTLKITGLVTIKGTSREVVFEVTEGESSRSPQGDEVAYYSAQVKLNRSDFAITRTRGLIGETLTVTMFIQALKQN